MSMYKKLCITNRALAEGDFLEQIKKVCDTDVSAIILREKELPEKEYRELAEAVRLICQKKNKLCILHYYKNAAIELEHRAIHLPMQKFLELTEEEKAFFQIIGVSTHTVGEAVQAQQLGASYVTASHIFSTPCKQGLEPRGLDYLAEVAERVNIPVFALGGIHATQIEACIEAGAAGVCMMSEYMRL